MKRFLPALVLTLLAQWSYGQVTNPQVDTIQWEYNGMMDIRNNDSIPRTGRIVSYGTEKMVWIQDGYDTQYSIVINTSDGLWNDLSSEGQLTYTVMCNEISGTAVIFRNSTGLHFRLELIDGEALTPRLSFNIQHASKI